MGSTQMKKIKTINKTTYTIIKRKRKFKKKLNGIRLMHHNIIIIVIELINIIIIIKWHKILSFLMVNDYV